MAGTYGIDVQLFHDADILDHTLHRDHIAAIGVELMTVGTLDEDRLSVDEQLASGNLDMAEADLLTHSFEHTAVFFQLKLQYI